MAIPLQALELEKFDVGVPAKPTLHEAYEILRDGWRKGDRDRELALHLMFLCWYMLIEPPHLTGLDERRVSSQELVTVFNEVHDCMLPVSRGEGEFFYVVGLMSNLSPWLLGDNDLWEARSKEYRAMYRQLQPNGPDPVVFEGRGAFGEYFVGQARVKDGY
jgi:hypothetical protein